MLIVVEGISAAGKTTWCNKHAASLMIPETGRCHGAPDRVLDPVGAARFWVEQGARRWTAALEMERSRGIAVCDTDPLKLHYIWTLWQIGAACERSWQEECAATRKAIRDGQLGFADTYLVKPISPWLARQQRDSDPTRSRRNFDLHVKLHNPLITWYRTLDKVLPGAVIWNFPDNGLASLRDRGLVNRSSIRAFDNMTGLLPTRVPARHASPLKAPNA